MTRKKSRVGNRRGVSTFDYNGKMVLARAGVEEVAKTLSEQRQAAVWERKITGRTVELATQCFFVFRLTGLSWTHILARDHMVVDLLSLPGVHTWSEEELERRANEARQIELNKTDARRLSQTLATRAFYYAVSDTACALGYEIFEDGESLEQLETDEGYEVLEWRSTIPSHEKPIADDVERWVDQLFREHDAFEPGLSFRRWVGYVMHKAGQEFTMQDSESLFERVDFIAL